MRSYLGTQEVPNKNFTRKTMGYLPGGQTTKSLLIYKTMFQKPQSGYVSSSKDYSKIKIEQMISRM